jgi:type IV secretory pathway VirJ component
MVAHRGSKPLHLTAVARAVLGVARVILGVARATLRVALLCTCLLHPGPSVRAEAPAPAHRKVATSRGEFDLVVYAPPGATKTGGSRPVVLLVSGEGGWKSFDILLSGYLTDDGFWVGGVDAKAYFSDPQDDRGLLAGDMRGYAVALNAAAGRPPDAPLILVGYSFGADLAPWISGAPGWGGRIKGQLLIGPDENGSLQYRITEMLGITYKDHSFSVADALRSSSGVPTVFIHGEKDGWSKSPGLLAVTAEPKKMLSVPGATHHFGGHLDELRAALKDGMRFIVAGGTSPPPAEPGGR